MGTELEELRILAEHMAVSLEDVYDSTAVLNHLGLNQNERFCESLSAYRVKQWQRGLTKAFHGNLVKAVAASDAVTWEGTRRLFKNDVERKDYLTTQGYERDIVTAALLLYNGREAEAYEGLWKLVRPFGRDNRFYVEGKGE